MPRKKVVFSCVDCGKSHDTVVKARACEAKHRQEAMDESVRKRLERAFPTCHKKDGKYEKHCVKCGTLLIEWERTYDSSGPYARPERGKELYRKEFEVDLGGRRCLPCRKVLLRRLARAK